MAGGRAASIPIWLRVITGFLGVVVAGESLALFIGTHFVSQDAKEWLTFKNEIFMLLDIITGAILVYIAVANRAAVFSQYVPSILWTILILQAYRIIEYLVNPAFPFCFNAGLFGFMILRTVILLIVLASVKK